MDVRDLGGHLDFTFRARAGTLPRGLVMLLTGSLRLVLVRGKYLPTGLHAAEASMSPLLQLVLLGLPLLGRSGPLRCLLLNSPAILTFLMDC